MVQEENLHYDTLETPIGTLVMVTSDQGVRYVHFHKDGEPIPSAWELNSDALRTVSSQLKEYFAGKRNSFDLLLAPKGTPFQTTVWRALCTIPYGETRSYKELAILVGNDKACRAVGGANGKNPISIIQPCHRVIAADGSLGGFSSGLARKEFLLNLEDNML